MHHPTVQPLYVHVPDPSLYTWGTCRLPTLPDTAHTLPMASSGVPDQVADHLYLKLTVELITLSEQLVFIPPSEFEIFRTNSDWRSGPDTLLHAGTLRATGGLGDAWNLPGIRAQGYRIHFRSVSRPDRVFLCAVVVSSHLLVWHFIKERMTQ